MTKSFAPSFSQQDIAERITFRLHTASRLVQQISQDKLKALELTQAQWRALSMICTQPNTTLQQLTAFAQISQPLMSQAVKALEVRGLVIRSTPKTDKRSSIIEANTAGMALFEEAYKAMMNIENELKSLLGEQDTASLNNLLDTIVKGISRDGR
jgi:DNA-binding MarR family transcriptional regulator